VSTCSRLADGSIALPLSDLRAYECRPAVAWDLWRRSVNIGDKWAVALRTDALKPNTLCGYKRFKGAALWALHERSIESKK